MDRRAEGVSVAEPQFSGDLAWRCFRLRSTRRSAAVRPPIVSLALLSFWAPGAADTHALHIRAGKAIL